MTEQRRYKINVRKGEEGRKEGLKGWRGKGKKSFFISFVILLCRNIHQHSSFPEIMGNSKTNCSTCSFGELPKDSIK